MITVSDTMSQGYLQYNVLTRKMQTVIIAKNTACLANLNQQHLPNDNRRVVVDEMNDGSSDELIFILMQVQNTMFCDIGKFSKFANEAQRSHFQLIQMPKNQKIIPATPTMAPQGDSDLT